MARRKFEGEACAYCGGPYDDDEHVVARGFFVVKDRGDLPQVPACRRCNREKGAIEFELMHELGFGGAHPAAEENLTAFVAKRLAKNARAMRRLRKGWSKSLVMQNGIIRSVRTTSLQAELLPNLFAFIARGLAWHHWGTRILPDRWVEVVPVVGVFAHEFAALRRMRPGRDTGLVNLGNSTFVYRGVQGTASPEVTVWEMRLCRLQVLTEANQVASWFGVKTGTVDMQATLRRWRSWRSGRGGG
jgi:hypothetical protein